MKTKKQIVVITGAWNILGDVSEVEGGVSIGNGSFIRYWGTTAGLGQIALGGATKKTILDPCGTTLVPWSAILLRINCEV